MVPVVMTKKRIWESEYAGNYGMYLPNVSDKDPYRKETEKSQVPMGQSGTKDLWR